MAAYAAPVPIVAAERVQPEPRGWTSWLTTTDHKRIGILYMVTTFVFFCLGGVEALMMRLQLGTPDNTVVTPQVYSQLFTMHGSTMIFLFVVPMMAGLANYFVPLMIGARDMAFPRLNALSYWLLLAGGVVFYASIFFNPPEAGWTSYAPLSGAVYSPAGGQDAWIYLIHLTGLSSILGAINFYATIANMRARGMSWGRLPLFAWAILTYSVLIIFAMPVIAVPTGVKVFNWIATLWRGTIETRTPLLFCVGFIALFVIGGISGVFLAIFPVDWQLNETYFVVAHIHFVLMGGAAFTIFAAIYYWFPKITGRMLSEGLGKLSFYLMFIGFLATFLIQHVMGLDGMPRRVYEYDNVGHLGLYTVVSTVVPVVRG